MWHRRICNSSAVGSGVNCLELLPASKGVEPEFKKWGLYILTICHKILAFHHGGGLPDHLTILLWTWANEIKILLHKFFTDVSNMLSSVSVVFNPKFLQLLQWPKVGQQRS